MKIDIPETATFGDTFEITFPDNSKVTLGVLNNNKEQCNWCGTSWRVIQQAISKTSVNPHKLISAMRDGALDRGFDSREVDSFIEKRIIR